MSLLLISHNLGLVAQTADNVAVMYASKIVEHAAVEELFEHPLHPYTRGLLTSIPRLGMSKEEQLNVIPGVVPNPLHFPEGCKFHTRCPFAEDRCRQEEPELREVRPGHLASCHLIENGVGPAEANA